MAGVSVALAEIPQGGAAGAQRPFQRGADGPRQLLVAIQADAPGGAGGVDTGNSGMVGQ